MSCANCKKAKKVVAKGFCGRCYQYQRRHGGKLPPAESLMVKAEYPHVITLKVTAKTSAALLSASKERNVTVTDLVRLAIHIALPLMVGDKGIPIEIPPP